MSLKEAHSLLLELESLWEEHQKDSTDLGIIDSNRVEIDLTLSKLRKILSDQVQAPFGRAKALDIVKAKVNLADHHIKGALPVQVFEANMRHSLQIVSEEFNLGPLTYCGWCKLRSGIFCFTIAGKCPIHKREHRGGAWRWQIHQHPVKRTCFFKCWNGSKNKQFIELPLF
jgi:hypothetical protein